MNYYGTLDVIGEESEHEQDDIDRLGLFIHYKNDDTNVSPSCSEDSNKYPGYGSSQHRRGKRTRFTDMNKNMNLRELNLNFSGTDRRNSSPTSTKKIKVIYEPTYRMEPNPDQYFVWYKVRNALNKVIGPMFETYDYQTRTAGNFCKMVCTKSMTTIKKRFEWPRFRYVCHVTLIELNHQGVVVGSRGLMLPETDNFASCLFSNNKVVMVLTFHGIYYD